MNWRRGLLRVWLVAAICWAVATGLTIGLPQAIKTYWSFFDVPAAKTDKPPFDPSKPFTVVVLSDDEKTIADETLLTFLWIGMTPPFGILVLGAALAWALKGFRQS